MLLRHDDHGVLAIGQPSHAWLCGQLAGAWGNQDFGAVEPLEEVRTAAEQHDAGWRNLDLEPTYNPETGLPRSFLEMPLDVHLRLWTEGPTSLLSQSRYVALLVSLHGWRLYERRDLQKLPLDEAEAIKTFLRQQSAFQTDLFGVLGPDPAQVERNSLLIWTWDYLSLALCLNWTPATAKRAPAAQDQVDLTLQIPRPGLARLDPWPFASDQLTVRAEGRRLAGRFGDEAEMLRAFAGAPWETLELRLEPVG
ncbi:MAG: DUF3891 family protein [Solirubrobacterales bacterium]|nr:DUF3891 family protein [Solirubrobacterales bacterium]